MSNQYIVQSKKFGKILVVTCLTAPEFFFQGIVFIALFVKKFYVIFFQYSFFFYTSCWDCLALWKIKVCQLQPNWAIVEKEKCFGTYTVSAKTWQTHDFIFHSRTVCMYVLIFQFPVITQDKVWDIKGWRSYQS